MMRAKDLNHAKKEIEDFKRKIKTTQTDIISAYERTKSSPTFAEIMVLERKEKRFRTMKRRLLEMETNLRALQEGQAPDKVKPWTVSRPANESFLMAFVGA